MILKNWRINKQLQIYAINLRIPEIVLYRNQSETQNL